VSEHDVPPLPPVPTDADVLRALREWPGSTTCELSRVLGWPSMQISGALGRLEDQGLAAPVPSGGMPRGAPGSPRRWRAT
jgi:hypothetical protein